LRRHAHPRRWAPADGEHVLEHVRHVEEVLLITELAISGVDQRRVARLRVGGAVRARSGQELFPLDDDVVAVDREELGGELPIFEALPLLPEDTALPLFAALHSA